MEIILLRHGMPEIELNGWLDAKEIKKLVVEYSLSPVQDFPPDFLKQRFSLYHVVCSDLQRSIHSAKKLEFKDIHCSDAIFKEADLPHFDRSLIKLPTIAWVTLLRIMWLFGFQKNGESFTQAKIRAKQAANKLIALAQENEKVILIGHGLMNRLIAKQLRLKQWQGPASPGKKYWEFGIYTNL